MNKLFPAIKLSINLDETNIMKFIKKVKVKQSRYTPWRRLGGEEV
jgi:hypothetical protein